MMRHTNAENRSYRSPTYREVPSAQRSRSVCRSLFCLIYVALNDLDEGKRNGFCHQTLTLNPSQLDNVSPLR